MAYVLESSTARRYYGRSTDSKPVTQLAVDTIPNGSRLEETDTGRAYLWDGQAWVYASGPGSEVEAQAKQLELLGAIAAELQLIREIILS